MSIINLKCARENGFIITHLLKLTKKTYSNLSDINIDYYLKFRFPIMHRHFFRILSQNPEFIKTYCINKGNPFHFECRKWYLHNNPQWCCSIITLIQTRMSI